MRHGDEGVQALEAVYGALVSCQPLADALEVPLEGLADLVWPDPAPGDVEGRVLVVYSLSEDGTDVLALGPVPRLMTTVPVLVKVVAESRSYSDCAPAARAIYDALHGRTNVEVADGGVVLTCRRVGTIQYPEQAGGIDYRHLGQTFQAEVN